MTQVVDIEVKLLHETGKAHMVTHDDGVTKTWLPRSQTEISPSEKKGIYIATIPEWLALEKGLI